MKITMMIAALFAAVHMAFSAPVKPCPITEYTDLWPSLGVMPDRQSHQTALRENVKPPAGFDAAMPRLEWFAPPSADSKTDACMILVSGGAYMNTCDGYWVDWLARRLVQRGVTCVSLIYRTPRPKNMPIYKTAWQDVQRAVRIVRSQASKRGYNAEKIGMLGFSAGAHLTLMAATSSTGQPYKPVDELDSISPHVNWAVPIYPAYVLEDGLVGPNTRDGDAPDIKLSGAFAFDAKTPPMCFFHGGVDIYSPNASTQFYRQLRRMGIPVELHLYADRNHGFFSGAKPGSGAANWYGRIEEFLVQMGFLGPLGEKVALMSRYDSDSARALHEKQDVWPKGRVPDFQKAQCDAYIEWHIPTNLTTKAIQIIYSGGSYNANDPDGFEVAPFRRYLNEKGMAVVTLKYRTPRPAAPLPKHLSAWQDLQRAIRLVRSQAKDKGLDPNRIGIMGSSAGGHLTMMGATSSRRNSYLRVRKDPVDSLSCKVQWAIAIYPAYMLVDATGNVDKGSGNEDSSVLAPELSFDIDSCPVLFIHGDADKYTSMNSVKSWEKLRRIGVQCDLHTLVLANHCFQRRAHPGTGSYTWMDRIWEFIVHKGFEK